MQSRLEFNEKLLMLLNEMRESGENFLIDFVKRSTEEQKRLFDAGLSKCDGFSNHSYHEYGRAVDLYFQQNGGLVDPKMGWTYWHERWEGLGGHKAILCDLGHFEG